MNEFRFYSVLKEKIEKLPTEKEFLAYCMNFAQAPYVWGGESLEGTDCSGMICGALMFAGFDIRVTADDIMDNITCPPSREGIKLVFFTKDGHATHIGVYISDTVVMHASGARGVTFDYDVDLVKEYRKLGEQEVFLNLDFEKCASYSGNAYGKDEDYA